jgi:hypothetical protein
MLYADKAELKKKTLVIGGIKKEIAKHSSAICNSVLNPRQQLLFDSTFCGTGGADSALCRIAQSCDLEICQIMQSFNSSLCCILGVEEYSQISLRNRNQILKIYL